MNGKELLCRMSEVEPKFVAEAEEFMPVKRQRSLSRRTLLVALIGALMLLVGCGATWAYLRWEDRQELQAGDIDREDVHLSILEASPSGARLAYKIDGVDRLANAVVVQEGPVTLEKKTADGWELVPQRQGDLEYRGQEVLTAGEDDFWISWTTVYGLLEPGTYRLGTVILEGDEPFYGEFEITEEMTGGEYDLAAELLEREFCHIRITYNRVLVEPDTLPEERRDSLAVYEAENSLYQDAFYKCGEDMMELSYRDGELYMGVLYLDGVKYKLTNVDPETYLSPIAGWEVWPDYDLNRLTGWAAALTGEKGERQTQYHEDGSVNQITVISGPAEGDGYVDHYETVYEILPTSQGEIAEQFATQDVNFYREFSWEEDREKYTALNTAFQNGTSSPVETVAEVIALAKNECDVEYTQVRVYRDEGAKMWKVEFQILYGHQGCRFVYLNDEGITQRVSEAGPKVWVGEPDITEAG